METIYKWVQTAVGLPPLQKVVALLGLKVIGISVFKSFDFKIIHSFSLKTFISPVCYF